MSRSSWIESFGIGEIARQAGIATSAIRYYERIGLLPASRRVSGKRRYDPGILGKLRIIRLAQEAGFSLAEIQSLMHDFPAEAPPGERWQMFAGDKIAQLDDLIRRAQAQRAFLERTQDCQCATLEDCAAGLASEKAISIAGWSAR